MYQSSFYNNFPADGEVRRRDEKNRLRSGASYIGALSLTLTIVMQYALSVVVNILVKCGAFTAENLDKPYLGLSNTQFMILYMGVYALSLLLPTMIVSAAFKKNVLPFGPSKSVPFGLAFFGVIAAVGLCMLSNVINSYLLQYFSEIGLSVPEAPQTMVETPTSLALNLFTIAVLPALLEEMIYRGCILRTLRPYGNGLAVVVSSVFFSLMHGNLRQIPFAFMVGLVLGYLYVSTNNIWLPIAVHFANNAISVLMEYFAYSVPASLQGAFYTIIIYGFIALGSVCTLVLFFGYGRRLRMRKSTIVLSIFERIGALFSSLLFTVSLLMYILLLFMEW